MTNLGNEPKSDTAASNSNDLFFSTSHLQVAEMLFMPCKANGGRWLPTKLSGLNDIHDDNSITINIRELVRKKFPDVSFEIWDKQHLLHDPQDIIRIIHAFQRTIADEEQNLPSYFDFLVKGRVYEKRRLTKIEILWNGNRAILEGGWGKAIIHIQGKPSEDVSEMNSIPVDEARLRTSPNRVETVSQAEIRIRKRPISEFCMPLLQNWELVCKTAISYGWVVKLRLS